MEKHISLTEDVWQDCAAKWQAFSLPKGEFVSRAGEVERYFYFIEEGLVRGYFVKDGEEFNMGFSYTGDPCGVFDSFYNQTPAQWSMETLLPTRGLKISYYELQDLYLKHPILERWGRMFFTEVSIGLGLFIRSLLADSAEDKFRKLMQRSPHILQLVPQKHLASYLGMTPETFSRMRRNWMANEIDIDQDK